jgi:hypothetical protein
VAAEAATAEVSPALVGAPNFQIRSGRLAKGSSAPSPTWARRQHPCHNIPPSGRQQRELAQRG